MRLKNTGTRVRVLAACALVAVGGLCAYAQTQSTEQHATDNSRESREARLHAPEITETIFLNHATERNDLNDVQTGLRNVFPSVKIYGIPGQYAITVKGTAEEMQDIKKMVAELDRPRKVYRVTYSVTDVENGKRTGTQHYSLVVASGSRGILKEGKRVPLVTGATGDKAESGQSSQVQYIDVGVMIDASIDGQGLKTKVELTGVAEEKSSVGTQDPVIQQTMVENASSVTGGKPVVLGTIDVPGTVRHEEIEVTTELITQ
jgi:type II secretory pathway component GspD/PulD (secretin)